MDPRTALTHVDHTLLKPDASAAQIEQRKTVRHFPSCSVHAEIRPRTPDAPCSSIRIIPLQKFT